MIGKPNNNFRPVGKHEPSPLFRERPKEHAGYLEFAAQDGFGCCVNVDWLRTMAEWGQRAGRREVIGRLGGRHCTDSRGPYVLVERATLNQGAQCGVASVIADIAAQEEGRRAFERQCRARDCIGWWHSHPSGFDLFYSSTDRENQYTWSNPNSIGIVLNPSLKGEGLKVFRGPASVELKLVNRRQSLDDAMCKARLNEEGATSPVRESHETQIPVRTVYDQTVHEYKGYPAVGITVGVAAAIVISLAALLFAVETHILVWTSSMRRATVAVEEPRTLADNSTMITNPHHQQPAASTLTGLDNQQGVSDRSLYRATDSLPLGQSKLVGGTAVSNSHVTQHPNSVPFPSSKPEPAEDGLTLSLNEASVELSGALKDSTAPADEVSKVHTTSMNNDSLDPVQEAQTQQREVQKKAPGNDDKAANP